MNADWSSRMVGFEEEMSIARSIPLSAGTSVSGRAISPSATSTPASRDNSVAFAALVPEALRTNARTATPRADSLRTSSAPFRPLAPVTRITLEDYDQRRNHPWNRSRSPIHDEPGRIWADRFLVRGAAAVRAATRGGSRAAALDPRISHRWRDDPGSRRCRCWSSNAVPCDDRLRRPGNGRAGSAGTRRSPRALPWGDRAGLALRRRWDAGHRERDHPVHA